MITDLSRDITIGLIRDLIRDPRDLGDLVRDLRDLIRDLTRVLIKDLLMRGLYQI